MNFQRLAGSLNIVVALTATILLLGNYYWAGLIVWFLGYGFLLLRQFRVFKNTKWRRFPSLQVVTRIIFLIAILGMVFNSDIQYKFIAATSVAGVIFLVNANHKIGSLQGSMNYRVENFETLKEPPSPSVARKTINLLLLFSPVVFIFIVSFELSGLYFLVPLVLSAILFVYVAFALLKRKAGFKYIEAHVKEALEELEPRFVVYWSAPKSSKFHLTMWMEHLLKADKRFFILVRNKVTFNEAVDASLGVPVVWARTLVDVDNIIVPSLNSVFYTNNGAQNTHMVRHAHLKHIQLLHGDSEKTPSFNPVTAMYDRIYVAGQAAIDRYEENGVHIPKEKFVIVGRPQVQHIEIENKDIKQKRNKTVLYAPTWNGYFEDTAYSSLEYFLPVIEELVADNVKIIFRPHPYCSKDPVLSQKITEIQYLLKSDTEKSGNHHIWGKQAEEDLDLIGCYNLSDAMISDVSSVISDYLFSGKPLGIATGRASDLEYLQKWKLTQGAYIFTADHVSNAAELQKLLVTDPLKNTRLQMRNHYLGDFEPETYDETFVRELKNDIQI